MIKRACWTLMLGAAVLAAQPRVQNARMETRAATDVGRDIQTLVAAQIEPAWFGYSVPVIPGDRQSCCYYNSDGFSYRGCALESGYRPGPGSTTPPAPIQLEGPKELNILVRAEGKRITKLRTFTPDCELDAGNTRFVWFTGVQPKSSLEFLNGFVTTGSMAREDEQMRNSAAGAIAMHSDPAADALLEKYMEATQPDSLRKKIVFWLGAVRGRKGYELLARVVKQDPSDSVREQATHGLSVSKEPEAQTTLFAVARDDRSSKVRGQALFWIAQKAGQKAASAIRDAIENDPQTDVKKRAVFALSQLPKDEGIPLLIDVAKNNKNPEVRKQAMFWLGQSKDPRALTFFEQVLTR